MRFLDRHNERQRLERVAANATDAAFVVVWGRRRIGKTRLLLEWVREHGGLYWVADESAAEVQRRFLAQTLESRLEGFAAVQYPDWASLLARLAKDAQRVGWRGPFVFDEFPYVVAAAPEAASVFQRFIDHEAKQAGLIVAVSGSSQRMMQGAVLDSGAPLYGRACEVIKLAPLPAGYIGEALGLADPAQMVRAHAFWGGVPRYWELAQPFGAAIDKAACSSVLDPLGSLHDEPHRLLQLETPSAVALRPILDTIGMGYHRVSEIGGRLGQPPTSLARPLARLQELGFVIREVPFSESAKATKRALYRLGDPFLRFWFRIVAPRRSLLAQSTPKVRKRLLDESLPGLRATAWEDLCRAAVPRLEEHLGTQYGSASRFWHGKGPEWDVVAESVDKQRLLLGEAKWTDKPVTSKFVEQAVRDLLTKGALPKAPSPRAAGVAREQVVQHAVFVPALPKTKLALPSGVFVIDAATVLAALR